MIKKTILVCVIAFSINNLVAQENIVKAGTLPANLGIQYERSINEHFSLIGQIGSSSITITVNGVDTKSTGLGYYIEGRYYFSSNKDLMEGWHIGPFYNSMNTKDKNNLKTKISSFGVASGYQWIFNSHITLGVIFGVGTLNFDSDNVNATFLKDIKFLPHFGLTLGYNF